MTAFVPKIDWECVTLENATLILRKAEERLNGTVADFEALDKRRMQVATAIIGILGGLGALLVSAGKNDVPLFAAALVAGIQVVVVGAIFVEKVLRSAEYRLPGLDPCELLKNDYLKLKQERLVALVAASHQEMIEKNAERNRRIGERIDGTIRKLFVAPVIFATVYVIGTLIT